MVVNMQVDYNKLMEKVLEQIKDLKIKPKLLLHSCCAPCSSSVIERLISFFDITILYYNPNIEPKEEYEKRKLEQKIFLKLLNDKNNYGIKFLDCDYDNDKFKKMALGLEDVKEGGQRCFKCYKLRLEYTAQKASKLEYDYFGTTLSISPYKNAIKLNEIGLSLEQEYQIKYLVADFKKRDGYKKSIELSKQYNLYRQNYCGCIYSKGEK